MDDQADRLIDESLVLEAQAGDSSAMDALVRRWQGRLFAYAKRLVRRDDAAADACQDAWMGIVRGLSGLDDPDNFPAWAYRIVTNKCKDWLQRDSRRRGVPLELADDGESLASPHPDAIDLREAFELLPGHMQAVLMLHYIDRFAVDEIANILDVPEGTVKSRLHRARAELKKVLEK